MLFLKDQYLFYVLEIVYLCFGLYCAYRDIPKKQKGKGSIANVSVSRGDKSMSVLSGTYAALAFLVVLTTLNVEPTQTYRVFFLVINITVLAYLIYFNVWFRNKIFQLHVKSRQIEE